LEKSSSFVAFVHLATPSSVERKAYLKRTTFN
jgi:hypothetical protein